MLGRFMRNFVFLTVVCLGLSSFSFAQSGTNCPPPKDNSLTCNYKKSVGGGMVWNGNNSHPVYYLYCVIKCSLESTVPPKCTGNNCVLSQPSATSCPNLDDYKHDLKSGCTERAGDCERKANRVCAALDTQGAFNSVCKQRTIPCEGCTCIDSPTLIEPPLPTIHSDAY